MIFLILLSLIEDVTEVLENRSKFIRR